MFPVVRDADHILAVREEPSLSLDPLPLETRSLRLRRAVPGDAAGAFALSREPAFRAWLPSQVYADEAQARSVLEFLVAQYSTPADPRSGAYVLMVEHRAEGALIGHVGFSPFEGEVEVGFAIGERHQGRGLATEAVTAASRWAIATFGLGRILGIAAAANVASKRTLARSGFSHREDRVMRFQGSEQQVSVFAMEARPRTDPGA